MLKDKKKKLTHIDVKDNGLIISSKVGTKLADTKATLELNLIRSLIKGSNETNLARYKIMQNINMRNFNLEVGKLINQTSKAVKTALKEDKTVNLKPNQVASISTTINKGLVLLQKSAVQTYQRTLNDLFLKVKSADNLKDQLQKHINSGLNLGVVYQNGREYQFDTYFEMKARTDIQVDIKDNLVDSGREAGVVFYITSYYGDCAKDHAEWQGKIYVDDKWDSIAPKDRIDEIDSYIKANDIKTVKYITEGDVKLTTRPNCRHYFMPIGIDEVLGAKTEKDVNKLREERNLNFNGKYKPEKYEALQKQRLNERKIRAEKQEINKLESELALHPENYKKLQSEILLRQDRVKVYQADQRSLIKQYSNLERRYDREALGNRVTLGAENSQDLTFKSNEDKISLEKEANVDNVDEFVEATSKEEATKFAKDVLGIERVNYGKLDLKVVNEMNRRLYKTKNANLQERLKFIGSAQERNKALKQELLDPILRKFKRVNPNANEADLEKAAKKFIEKNFVGRVESNVLATSHNKQVLTAKFKEEELIYNKYTGITINEANGKNYTTMTEDLVRMVKTKQSPVGCDTVESVVDHELGHQLDYKFGLRDNPEIQAIYNEAIKDKEKFTNDLSRYAWDNNNKNSKYAEMIAEAWSEYCNNPEPREIATKIGNIIKEMMENGK